MYIFQISDCKLVYYIMKGTSSVASSGIVPELLTSYNYKIWSAVMQNYLRGKGLWDVVESASEVKIEEASKKMEEDIEKGVLRI